MAGSQSLFYFTGLVEILGQGSPAQAFEDAGLLSSIHDLFDRGCTWSQCHFEYLIRFSTSQLFRIRGRLRRLF